MNNDAPQEPKVDAVEPVAIITPTVVETTIPVQKQEIDEEKVPDWLFRIVRRHQILDKKYHKAFSEFAIAWNNFLLEIEEINMIHGTNFSVAEAIEKFGESEVTIEADED